MLGVVGKEKDFDKHKTKLKRKEQSKSFIFLALIFFPVMLYSQKIHEFESGIIKQYLNDTTLPKIVRDYYTGKLIISDDDRTLKLIKVITTKDDHFFPLFFYTFNRIVNKSDGSLSEMLEDYCIKIICNDPNETFIYFSQNEEGLERYACLIGGYFYLQGDLPGENQMTYNQFQDFLNKQLNLQDESIKTVLKKFNSEIKKTIKSME